MKRLRFLAVLLLILSACSEKIVIKNPAQDSDVMGSVSIALTADERTSDAYTKAGAELPDVDDFRLEIYKVSTRMRLYNDTYANTKGKDIKLNAGEYRLVAYHGDTLGCGFDKPYYLADPTFTIKGYNTEVQAEAKLANVRMSVEYGETISAVYSDFYTKIIHKDHKGKEVTFGKGETRYGYLPGGQFRVQVYVLDTDDSGKEVWKYTEITPTAQLPLIYEPNDEVLFSITTADATGRLTVNITFDGETVEVTDDVEIPAFTVPQPAPAITPSGFEDNTSVHYVTEGVQEDHTATVNFVARGRLAHCYVKVESDYLRAQGVPAEVDFANLTPEQETVLRAAGFSWDPEIQGSRSFSYVDLTGVINLLNRNVGAALSDREIAKFTVKVVDSVNKSEEDSFSIMSRAIVPTLSVSNNNVWARRILNPTAAINRGNVSLLKIQYSKDNNTWTDFEDESVAGNLDRTYAKVVVEPATKYYLRAIYNNNTVCSSQVQEFTTETAAQLPNSGFEDWTKQTHSDNRGSRDWYQPWGGSSAQWWAVNSMAALNSTTTVWGIFAAEQNHRMVPTVSYSTDKHSGSRSAHLFCVMTGGSVTADSQVSGNVYPGELFVGTSGDKGAHASEGRSFISRPSAIKFHYKFAPQESENFYVKYEIKDAGGAVISSKEITNGPAAANWTEYTLPVSYMENPGKAASLYIIFKASASSSPGATAKKTIEFTGNNEKGHFGSSLRIDDIELVYE